MGFGPRDPTRSPVAVAGPASCRRSPGLTRLAQRVGATAMGVCGPRGRARTPPGDAHHPSGVGPGAHRVCPAPMGSSSRGAPQNLDTPAREGDSDPAAGPHGWASARARSIAPSRVSRSPSRICPGAGSRGSGSRRSAPGRRGWRTEWTGPATPRSGAGAPERRGIERPAATAGVPAAGQWLGPASARQVAPLTRAQSSRRCSARRSPRSPSGSASRHRTGRAKPSQPQCSQSSRRTASHRAQASIRPR